MIWVIGNVDGNDYKEPFSKGILARSLRVSNIGLDEAYGIANEIENSLIEENITELTVNDLAKYIADYRCCLTCKQFIRREILNIFLQATAIGCSPPFRCIQKIVSGHRPEFRCFPSRHLAKLSKDIFIDIRKLQAFCIFIDLLKNHIWSKTQSLHPFINRLLCNAGIYLIKQELLSVIPRNTFYNATDFMDKLIELGKKVIRFPITGYWYDIGKPEDFRNVQDFASNINSK